MGRTDIFAGEISFKLTNVDTGEHVKKGKMNRSYNREYYEYQRCLDSLTCWEFEIMDYYGDGLIEEFGGRYAFLVDEEVLITSLDDEGGDYGFGESAQFGHC